MKVVTAFQTVSAVVLFGLGLALLIGLIPKKTERQPVHPKAHLWAA